MPAYISEINYASSNPNNFIEIVVDAGTDVSAYTVARYDNNGQIAGSYSLGTKVTTIAGKDVYVINQASGLSTLKPESGVALVDNTGTVLQFVSFEGSSFTATDGPANGLTTTSIGTASNGQSLQSDNGGASYYTQTAPNSGTIACYAPGTLIDTPDGPRAVETLQPGDLVTTLDHGPQPIRWVHSGDQPLEVAETDAKPVQIAAGALGPKIPSHDLIVSPQHRILVGGHRQLQHRFEAEVFAPAKSLTRLPSIRHMKGKTKITWIHFACDRHEVVTANGCLSESLLLGPMVLNGPTAQERRTLTAIFGPAPTPGTALNGPAARDCLRVGASRRQLADSHKNKPPRSDGHLREWDPDPAMERFEIAQLQAARARNLTRPDPDHDHDPAVERFEIAQLQAARARNLTEPDHVT